jgi:hypothetical protein
MSDFFGALELELRAAGQRRPRQPIGLGTAIGAVCAVALVAAAVLLVAGVSGGGGGDSAEVTGDGKSQADPVGTVIPRSETHYETRALVVANGTAPVTGPWQIEVSRTKGSHDTNGAVMWHRGYCLFIHVLDAPGQPAGSRSGFCGAPRSLGFRKTPGFSRSQSVAPSKPLPKEVLVWGRVPDRASQVVIDAPDRRRIKVVPEAGPKRFPGQYYAIPVKPPMQGARINWLDENGKPGSRGIGLMPPISR